jgi:hypothetical protein
MNNANSEYQKENPLLSVAFNIFIPVIILNKGNSFLGATLALVIALSFPLIYGVNFAIKARKVNFIALLGFLNVLFSGGFALIGLTGIWFAVKEAVFPLLIGIFVLISAWTSRPFMKIMMLNPQVFRMDFFEEKTRACKSDVEFLFKQTTWMFSGSFVLSAILNFGLAYRIFLEIDPALSSEAQRQLLNEQIASMTLWSMLFIALPMMIVTAMLMIFFFKRLSQLTEQPWQSFLNHEK